MRRFTLGAGIGFVFLFVGQASVLTAAEATKPTNDAPAAAPSADDLVREALLAEAEGNVAARSEKLKGALATDQASAAVHWLAGEIQIGDRWMSIDDAAQQAAQAGKVDEYRKQRDQRENTLDDHIALARLCAKSGLKESERGQLILALQIDSNNKEALTKLGLVRKHFYKDDRSTDGLLLTPEQYEQMKAAEKNAAASFARWTPTFQKLRRRYETNPSERETVLRTVRSLNEIDVISSMEYVFGRTEGELALAAVDALGEMSKQEATESLVRYIMFCGNTKVQDAAVKALRYRRRESYLPLMISKLQAPIQSKFNEMLLVDGALLQIPLLQYQEGLLTDELVVRYSYAPAGAARAMQPLIAAQSARKNAVNSVRNERLFDALASITGAQIRDPSDWWNWWFDENEYQPLEKTTNVTLRASCFIQGTPVWTSTGPMAIEKIKPGEAVLSQNPVTGELAYKPVLATTTRPPSPLVEVTLSKSTIRGTRGHPYWVSGEGWRMAKELKAGQSLHTVNGPARIESAEPSGEEACYNLIVADFNTYFVGDAKVLVHDNTLRGPNTIRVPGLVEN